MRNDALFGKVFGSVAAANIGSAIGAAVEWVSVPGGGSNALQIIMKRCLIGDCGPVIGVPISKLP